MLASVCVSICSDIYCKAVNDTGAKIYVWGKSKKMQSEQSEPAYIWVCLKMAGLQNGDVW